VNKVFLILFLTSLTSTYAAGPYFVRKDGSDSNAGTSDTAGGAYLTIQKGVNSAVAGETIFVRAGSYGENVTSVRGGGNSTPIIIDGGGVATNLSFLSSHSNIYVQNFTLMGRSNSWTIFLDAGAHRTVISNCFFDAQYLNLNSAPIIKWNNPVPSYNTNAPGNTSPWGVNLASGCLIISNTFYRLIQESGGIQMYGFTNTIFGNTFKDSDNVDIFHVYGGTNRVIGNFITNSFTLNGSGHGDWFQVAGQQGYGARGILIESNTVFGFAGDQQLCMFEGQDCVDMEDFTFRNNIFIGVSSKGTMGCRDVKWYNNFFYKCSTNPITAGPVLIFTSITNTTYTNYAFSSGHMGRVYNNVFLYCGSASTNNNAYKFNVSGNDVVTNNSADYNFIAKSNYALVDIDGGHNRVGDPGYDWQKWWEDHGINGGNPRVFDETRYDFRLQPTSVLINAGTNLSGSFTRDIAGHTRDSSFDMGPYEYISPLTYYATNPIVCDLETRVVMGTVLSYPNVNTIVWPTNQYGNVVNIYRRTYTNNPLYWPNWTSIYTNAGTPIAAGVYNDTNVTSGTHYEYQLRVGSTNTVCGSNIDFGYYAFQYLNAGVYVPLRDQRGNVILLVEQGITNTLNTEITNLVADLRGDGYKVYRHDIAAVDVTSGATWYNSVTNTKALIIADYTTSPSTDWSIFIVGHVAVPYSGDNSPGFHGDNVGAHPADWFYADTNATSWTDSTVNDSTSTWPDEFNVPGDGKFDQGNMPTHPEIRLGRVDLRNMPAFALSETGLLQQYLNRNHQWRHKQFTVRDRAIVGTNSSVTVPPYEVYGLYSSIFGNGTNYDVSNWLTTATNAANSYLFASSHGNGSYTNDLLLGNTTNFAQGNLYSVFNSMYGSYYGDWDSSQHPNDVGIAPLCTTGYTLGLFYLEQQANINPAAMGEPYSDDFYNLAANWFVGSSAQYIQLGYWYTNGSTFLNPQRLAVYTSYMGDPTLRIRQVAPPTNVTITVSGSDNIISWTNASDTYIQGYYIYRTSTADLNSFTRLTSTPTNSPYTDSSAAGSAYTYMVRTIKLEQSDQRSFFNASQGSFAEAGTLPTPPTPGKFKLKHIRGL